MCFSWPFIAKEKVSCNPNRPNGNLMNPYFFNKFPIFAFSSIFLYVYWICCRPDLLTIVMLA